MAVVIRMQRAGTRNRPYWHVVAADRRMRRDGRFIEKLGHYDPVPDPPVIELDVEKIEGWIRKGAQPSDKVRSLINRVQNPESVRVKKKKSEKKAAAAAEPAGEAAVATEAPPVEAEATAEPETKAEAAAQDAAEAKAEDAPAATAEAGAPAGDAAEGEAEKEETEKKTKKKTGTKKSDAKETTDES